MRDCPRTNRWQGPQAQRGRGRAKGARGGRGGRNANGGSNGNKGRNKNGGQGRGREANGRVNAIYAEPTLRGYEEEQPATLFAEIDNPIIQAPATQGGDSFNLLIDCGSTHLFLSP